VLLRFFRLGVLALNIGKGHVERFVSEADSNGIHRDTFLVQRVGVGFAEAVKLCSCPWRIFFLLALETKMLPGFRLNVQRALLPVEVGVLGVLHLGVTHAGVRHFFSAQIKFSCLQRT
jgi:hypothetical protein